MSDSADGSQLVKGRQPALLALQVSEAFEALLYMTIFAKRLLAFIDEQIEAGVREMRPDPADRNFYHDDFIEKFRRFREVSGLARLSHADEEALGPLTAQAVVVDGIGHANAFRVASRVIAEADEHFKEFEALPLYGDAATAYRDTERAEYLAELLRLTSIARLDDLKLLNAVLELSCTQMNVPADAPRAGQRRLLIQRVIPKIKFDDGDWTEIKPADHRFMKALVEHELRVRRKPNPARENGLPASPGRRDDKRNLPPNLKSLVSRSPIGRKGYRLDGMIDPRIIDMSTD